MSRPPPTTVPRSAHGPHALALVLLPLLAVAIWIDAARTHFGADDIVSLARAAGLERRLAFFRPLSTMVVWRLEYAAFGLEPFGYHVVSIALHALNAVAVYFLAARVCGRRGLALAAATLFVSSGVAFTAVYSASAIGDLLITHLLLIATLLFWASGPTASGKVQVLSGACFLLAVLAKESAVVWPLVLLASLRIAGFPPAAARVSPGTARRGVPIVAIATLLAAGWLGFGLGRGGMSPGGAYAMEWSPAHLLTNAATYVSWAAQPGVPMRDQLAAPAPGAIPVFLAVSCVLLLAWRLPPARATALKVGLCWFAVFLLPVLPLRHHSYLYYVYLPWVGGSLALAALGDRVVSAAPSRLRSALSTLLVSLFVLIEYNAIAARRSATIDHLPADRTLRDSELLRHALGNLEASRLPAGTRVGFVNPAPAPRVDLVSGERTSARDLASHETYYPLEALMQNGRTFRVFLPELQYAGFSDTIPSTWGDVECFLFEQRGYLRRWGHGAEALENQAAWRKTPGRL